MRGILFFGFSLAVAALTVLGPEVRAETNLVVSKACAEEGAQKGLGSAAREKFIAECVDSRTSKDAQVTIKGGKVSDADKQKLIYCGGVAQTRHLSGDSFNRFLRECLAK